MIAMMIAITGNLISIYLNVYTLTFAKFLFGLGVGLYCPIIPKYIEETVPAHLFEPMIASYLVAQAIGTMSAYFLGALLPPNSDTEALKKTNTWLYPFVIFPIALNIIGYIGFFNVVQQDSIKFLIKKKNFAEAKKHIAKMYPHSKGCEDEYIEAL